MLVAKVSFIFNSTIIDSFSYNLMPINKSFSALFSKYKIFEVLSARALLLDAFKNTIDCSYRFGMSSFCKLSFHMHTNNFEVVFILMSHQLCQKIREVLRFSVANIPSQEMSYVLSALNYDCACIEKLFTSKYMFICFGIKMIH